MVAGWLRGCPRPGFRPRRLRSGSERANSKQASPSAAFRPERAYSSLEKRRVLQRFRQHLQGQRLSIQQSIRDHLCDYVSNICPASWEQTIEETLYSGIKDLHSVLRATRLGAWSRPEDEAVDPFQNQQQ